MVKNIVSRISTKMDIWTCARCLNDALKSSSSFLSQQGNISEFNKRRKAAVWETSSMLTILGEAERVPGEVEQWNSWMFGVVCFTDHICQWSAPVLSGATTRCLNRPELAWRCVCSCDCLIRDKTLNVSRAGAAQPSSLGVFHYGDIVNSCGEGRWVTPSTCSSPH